MYYLMLMLHFQIFFDHFKNFEILVLQENVSIPSGFQILKICKDEWKEIVLGSIFSVITGATMPVFAVFYSEIFNVSNLCFSMFVIILIFMFNVIRVN